MSGPATPPRPPIFVVGSMRSGTTLMRLLLNRHPHIAVGPESGIVQALAYLKSIPAWDRGHGWYRRFGLDEAAMNAHLRRLCDDIFADYAARQGKPRWGEKTPFHWRWMEEVAAIFPGARQIVMLRHAGAVAMSLKKWARPVDDSLRDWLRAYRAMLRATARLGPDQVLWCRYEDLLRDPVTVSQQVMMFVDEPWSERLLAPDRPAAPADAVTDGLTRTDDPIAPERIDTWTASVTADEQELLRRLAGPALADFGYPLMTAVPRAPLALPATLRRGAGEARTDDRAPAAVLHGDDDPPPGDGEDTSGSDIDRLRAENRALRRARALLRDEVAERDDQLRDLRSGTAYRLARRLVDAVRGARKRGAALTAWLRFYLRRGRR